MLTICGANSYEKKYYLNPDFEALPTKIKQELQIMCVVFTEKVGGILTLSFDEDGSLFLSTDAAEEDILYDEITAGLMVRELRNEKAELFEELELYYKVFFSEGDLSS